MPVVARLPGLCAAIWLVAWAVGATAGPDPAQEQVERVSNLPNVPHPGGGIGRAFVVPGEAVVGVEGSWTVVGGGR